MSMARTNADLFFIEYKRKKNLIYIFPLILTLIAATAAVLFYFNLLPFLKIEALYCYFIAGGAGVFLVTTFIVASSGKDRTKLPTSEQISSLLAEDISTVKSAVQSQLSPEFAQDVTREMIIVNHCADSILGFKPYVKKATNNKIFCSLNKITVFSFGSKKMQIHTQIVDILTGIDIMQKTIKIPYSDVRNCYIAYESGMMADTVKFSDGGTLNKNKLLPKFVSAVKDCKEILRICVDNSDTLQDSTYDMLVADYQLFYTTKGLFKSIVSINEGKELEKEILKRSGHIQLQDKIKVVETAPKSYNFIDDIAALQTTQHSVKWN